MKNHLKHLSFLIKAILIALCFFSISRVIFYFYTADQFPNILDEGILGVFMHGLRFDLSSLAYINILFILLLVFPTKKRESKAYQQILKTLFISFNSFALLMNLGDVVNMHFTNKRMTADVLSFVLQGDDANNVAMDFIKDYWTIFIFWALLTFGLYKSYSYLQARQFFLRKSPNNWKSWLITLIVLALTVVSMRGGLQLRPIKNIHASYYGQGKYVPLILNSPFSILSTLGQKQLEEKKYFSSAQAKQYFDADLSFYSDSSHHKNVVLIILESFAREYIGFYNNFEGYTPFLDSLMSQSLVCTHAYANGKKSIEGIPAIINGIPALTDKPYILSQYGAQKSNNIASILHGQGYETSFYHGGHPGTMGFDAYAEMAGFDDYVDMSKYPKSEKYYDGKWGIFDEPFFQFFADELDQNQAPFFASIFSLSSHHPYTIPKQHQGKFKKGELPIHESVGYSDYALKEFFKRAKQSDWYDNTIFVITADHTFKSTHKSYQNSNGLYAIPIIFHSPSDSLVGSIDKVCQQTDIFPSIIDYLKIDTNLVSFGNSIWADQGYAVNYLNDIYQFFEEEYLLQFNGEKSLALYNTSLDSLLKNNLILEVPDKALDLENKLKALIQDYNYRMIHNQLELDD